MSNISFNSDYNLNMQGFNSNEAFNPLRLNEMFAQVLGSISALQARTHGNTIDVRNFAPGDGSDQSVQIRAFFDAAKDGDILLFTPGHYKVTRPGLFYTFSGRSVIIRALPGAILEMSDQGLSIVNSSHVEVTGLTLKRSTQASWGAGKTGISIRNSSNVIVQNNEISQFTDAIGVIGSNSLDSPSRNIVIRNNKLYDLGEEPIVVRSNLSFVIINENDCYRYLGDGILVKATWDLHIMNNYLHDPILSTDVDYNVFTGGQQGTNVPKAGGGISCNNEGGETGARNMTIHGNNVYGTSFGVILAGFKGAMVTSNVLKNIRITSAISVSFHPNPFNPNSIKNHEFIIQGNFIDTILQSTSTAAIEARTTVGPEGLDIGIIADNIILPQGNHWGIMANGNIIVRSNYIAQAGIAMDLKNGVVAIANIIEPGFETPQPERIVNIYDNVTFSNNSIKGKGTVIKILGSRNIITGNRMQYEGKWWAVHLETNNYKVEHNLIRDNILTVGSIADGRYLFGVSSINDGKNVVIDTLQDNNGNLYQLADSLVLTGPNSTRWKIVVDAQGQLKTTKL